MAVDPIPYEDIDVEMRQLIALLNRWPGLRTWYCCAGHQPDPGIPLFVAYVLFTAESQATVRALQDCMPNWGLEIGFASGDRYIRHVWIDLSRSTDPRIPSDALVYELHVTGYPHFYQRAQLEAIEQALRAALAAGESTALR